MLLLWKMCNHQTQLVPTKQLIDKWSEKERDNTDYQEDYKDYPNPTASSIKVRTDLILTFKHFGYLLPVRTYYVLLFSLGSPFSFPAVFTLLLTEELDTPMPGKNKSKKIIKKVIPKAFA